MRKVVKEYRYSELYYSERCLVQQDDTIKAVDHPIAHLCVGKYNQPQMAS